MFVRKVLVLALLNLIEAIKAETSLLSGSITTSTNVDNEANITFDFRDINRVLEEGDFATARDIYKHGKHANGYKISHFSFDAYEHLKDDAVFLFQIYGLANGKVENVEAYYTYADKFVEEALKDTSSGTLAYEAMVSLHLWSWVAHKLEKGFHDCVTGHEKADIQKFDEAIAFWIGAGQLHKMNSGHGLFEMATKAEYLFGQRDSDSRKLARVNDRFIDLYGKARMLMSGQEPCKSNDAVSSLYDVMNEMISVIRIPLMQNLINALIKNDRPRIRLYSLAIVPQISACRPMAHLYLQNMLLEEETYNPNQDWNTVIQLLQSSFDCLGFSCDDIGTYQSVVMPKCADPPGDMPLASYKPDSHVYGYSKIDLDVLQIKILTELRANTTAYFIYSLGKNAISSDYGEARHSLQHMATSSSRNKVPRFNVFKNFYSKINYADVEISMALAQNGRYGQLYNSMMRSNIVTYTAVLQILYMYALEKFWESLEACQTKSANMYRYDEAVSILIGSLEGPTMGYADVNDGMLLYNLANRNCFQFGTCDEISGVSRLAQALIKEFELGKKALNKQKCDKLEKHLEKIQNLLLVPILQTIVKYAYKAENYPPNELSTDLSMGEVAALSVIPILDFYSKSSKSKNNDVTLITLNMLIQKNVEPVKDGAQEVASALKTTFSHLNVSCALFGRFEGISLCDDDEFIKSEAEFKINSSSDASAFKYSTIISLFVTAVAFFI